MAVSTGVVVQYCTGRRSTVRRAAAPPIRRLSSVVAGDPCSRISTERWSPLRPTVHRAERSRSHCPGGRRLCLRPAVAGRTVWHLCGLAKPPTAGRACLRCLLVCIPGWRGPASLAARWARRDGSAAAAHGWTASGRRKYRQEWQRRSLRGPISPHRSGRTPARRKGQPFRLCAPDREYVDHCWAGRLPRMPADAMVLS